MYQFKQNDRVLVDSDEEYADGERVTIHWLNEEVADFEFDDKVWEVPLNHLELVCRKHSRYQARRKPISDCEVCMRIWEGKQK